MLLLVADDLATGSLSLALAVFFVSMVGLFCYQRWAAWLMAVVIAVFSIQLLFSPTVEPGILSYLGSLSDILTGLVLGIAFFTDALQEGA